MKELLMQLQYLPFLLAPPSSQNFRVMRFSPPESTEELQDLIQSHPSLFLYPNTKKIIRYRSMPFGTKLSKVVFSLGKPAFRIDNSHNVPGHRVLVYKYKLHQYKMSAQFHFYKKRLFMGVHIFGMEYQNEFSDIQGFFEKRYLTSSPQKSYILDEENNYIEFRQGVELNIIYMSGDKSLLPKALE